MTPNFRSSGRAGSTVPQLLSVAARRSPKRYAVNSNPDRHDTSE